LEGGRGLSSGERGLGKREMSTFSKGEKKRRRSKSFRGRREKKVRKKKKKIVCGGTHADRVGGARSEKKEGGRGQVPKRKRKGIEPLKLGGEPAVSPTKGIVKLAQANKKGLKRAVKKKILS